MKTEAIGKDVGHFSKFAKATAHGAGQPWSFGLAALTIAVWAGTGPVFGYSDTWQLVINTSTTIVTFLMVFLIQNTQNRDSQAIQLKLDELIRATNGAHTAVIDVEELTDGDIQALKQQYLAIARAGRQRLRNGAKDTGTPGINVT
jgi:low affinity Fe/Cu permease